jgi:hypothetical protein
MGWHGLLLSSLCSCTGLAATDKLPCRHSHIEINCNYENKDVLAQTYDAAYGACYTLCLPHDAQFVLLTVH